MGNGHAILQACAVDTNVWMKSLAYGIQVFVQPKRTKNTLYTRLSINGYPEERLLVNNSDVLRGGRDGVNHSKKLYSQGLYSRQQQKREHSNNKNKKLQGDKTTAKEHLYNVHV